MAFEVQISSNFSALNIISFHNDALSCFTFKQQTVLVFTVIPLSNLLMLQNMCFCVQVSSSVSDDVFAFFWWRNFLQHSLFDTMFKYPQATNDAHYWLWWWWLALDTWGNLLPSKKISTLSKSDLRRSLGAFLSETSIWCM